MKSIAFSRSIYGVRIKTDNDNSIVISSIFAYHNDGTLIEMVPPANEVEFIFNDDLECNLRRKPNFARNEIFYIKKKCNSFYNDYTLYIPANAIDIRFEQIIENKCGKKHILVYKEYSLNGKVLQKLYYGDNTYFEKENRISFKRNTEFRTTEYGKYLKKMVKEINETCQINVSEYHLEEILKHYDIVKKK